ncbi:hypothetical protein GGR51DRAFT_523582 [Nemania sp. FL0031]|nr:hypothetical protein GGR51DRAFT_523582 [Nemania sp. FL0031]
MASQFQVQKPYVLTALPRPLDPATGTYVVGEVYGYAPGSKKRKRRRAELTVGIDGEAINIYDVSSSRLVTSYPIPPQSRLSCPASSIRFKLDSPKDVSRYTYIASDESKTNKITLFKDSVGEASKTKQATCSVSLGRGQPVVWLAPVLSQPTSGGPVEATPENELLVMRADGEVVCLDGESLAQKWTTTAVAMLQDLADDARSNFTIEFCRSLSASEVLKGIFKGNNDAFNILSGSGPVDEESEVFVLVSSSGATKHRVRHLHIVGRLPSTLASTRASQGVVQLHVMPLVTPHEKRYSPRSYRLDARNGALLELHHHTVIIHDLTASIPKITSTMQLDGTNSFLPLSKTSLLCSTNTTLSIFNPIYKSLQNTVDIDLDVQVHTHTSNNEHSSSCQLVTYFSPLERAISIVGYNLVAIQLEAPKSRHAKRRAEGLLIDSIGRGLPGVQRRSVPSSASPKDSTFSSYLPGSIRGDYWGNWAVDQKNADCLLNSNDILKFESFLAEKFGIPVETAPVQNGDSSDQSTKNRLIWCLPKSRANYPPVDRRWVLYAISRSFQWNNALHEDSAGPRLTFQFPESNLLEYLVDAGHLTQSNLRAAFRDRLIENETVDSLLTEELVAWLSGIDPSLEILVVYLYATKLGVPEVIFVLRALMGSLQLVNEAAKPLPQSQANGTAESATNENDSAENENIGMELDHLEDEIQKTVSYLNNEDGSIRGRGLGIALTKLAAYPPKSAVKALRSIFKPHEILSLMYVLRIELVKGGWIDRYMEVDYRDENGLFDAPPDGILKLIANLLSICLDSFGQGGWLLNDTLQAGNDAVDFLGSLTHEIDAALEGLEEVVYLRGLLAGPVKYYEQLSKKSASAEANTAKPIAVQVNDAAVTAPLPLGLNSTSQRISNQKVVSGGEVVQRSSREKGHLISQKVGSYSLERIRI